MTTASENARKVLNSIKAKLNLDKFPPWNIYRSVWR